MKSVGIVGGTGPAGRGVAVRLARAGYDVTLGSRDGERARACAATLRHPNSATISGGSNDDAGACEVVIIATPWDSAVATARSLRVRLANKIVISMVNALVKEGSELVALYPSRGSMTAQLAFALPTSRVVGAFHHLPAAQMEDLESGIDADVLIVSDDVAARDEVSTMIHAMLGLHPVIAGSLSLAGAVEAFTAVCISVNIRYKAHSYVRLAGLERS